jgi:ABC-type multidrug transport system fused ATPase/permease subunit
MQEMCVGTEEGFCCVHQASSEGAVSRLPFLAVFVYAFQRVMPSLGLITNLKMQIAGGLPILEVLHSVINEKMVYLKDGAKVMSSFNESIEFRNVSFSYPGRSEALNNISIFLKKNQCTAIVG